MEASGLHIPHGLHSRLRLHPAAHPESWATQLRWYVAAAVVGFAVPFLGSSVFALQHDVYLGIDFAIVLALFAAYVVATGDGRARHRRRRWKPGVALGIIVGVALVRNVLSEDATPRPDGAYFVFELDLGAAESTAP